MKNSRGFIGIAVIIIIVLGIAIVGGGVFYVVNKNNTKNYILNQDNDPLVNLEDDHSEYSKNLSQEEVARLVFEKWNIEPCVNSQECVDPEITTTPDRGGTYLITVITTELDDSVSQTKREGLVRYEESNKWYWTTTQPDPNTWRSCYRGNNDGTTGWTTGSCI